MDAKRLVRVSKYLSKHLRHQPERLGIVLQEGGWVEVEQLLDACARNHFTVSRDELNEVVQKNDKQRFAFDETGQRIRANQGHSVEVDLQLDPSRPPALLYHGTPEQSVPSILATGLNKMARHHVHLHPILEDARTVGKRRGKPVILLVDSGAMARDGFAFFCSTNGVWLVDEVPPKYLKILNEKDSHDRSDPAPS